MSFFRLLRYEFKHFRRNRAKVWTLLFFFMACLYAVHSGLTLQQKQIDTLTSVESKAQETITETPGMMQVKKAPKIKWVDVEKPYWALRYVPTYIAKPFTFDVTRCGSG